MKRPAPETVLVAGPAGNVEVSIDDAGATRRGTALVAHPHPLMGGTKDNKVATTLARTLQTLGYTALRPNFRGVGLTEGAHDEGRGETEDLLAVVSYARQRYGDLPLICAGFSFGAYVQTRAAAALAPQQLILVAPPVDRYQIGAVAAGTLVIHSEHDEVVPLAAVLDWARPQHLPIVVLPGGGHLFHGQLSLLRQIITRNLR